MNEDEAPRSMRGRLALAGCVLGLLGLVLVTLLQGSAGLGSSAHWLLALVTPFVLQLTVACGVLALALLLLREWELLVVTLVLLAYNGQRIRTALTPRLEPDAEHAHRADEEPIRLLLANVNTANRGWDRVLALVEEEDPDVIALLEVSDAWLEGLAPLSQTHPLRAAEPRGDNFGIALWSRLEPGTAEVLHHAEAQHGTADLPAIRATFDLGSGRPVTLIACHPVPPIGRRLTAARNEQLGWLTMLATQAGPRAILAGDLNGTPWCLEPHLTWHLQDARATAGAGLATTWPARLPDPFRIPIDHVLHARNVTCTSLRVGPRIGSDHLPLIADLATVGTEPWSPARKR